MNRRTLTQANILGALLRFALPVFLALFLQAMYGAADLLVVGQWSTIADQSGVATGSMFTSAFAGVVTAFALGITVLVAEATGSGAYERAGVGIGAGICLFAGIGAVSTVVLALFARPIALALHAPAESVANTAQYIRICGCGVGFIIAYNLLGAVFRGIGDSKTPLATVALACIINIAGDLVLVIGFGLGAAGAAIATVLAQAVSVLVSLFIILRRRDTLPFRLRAADFAAYPRAVKRIVAIGAPVALQELLVGFSFLFIQSTVNSIGVVESAAVGVGEKVCAFLMLVASAYLQSMSAFVAQNNGAGLRGRSRKALWYGMGTALVAGAAMGALACFGGAQLAAIFSNDPPVIAKAAEYLRAYAPDCLLTAVLFCFIGYFNGCEKTVFVMLQGIIGSFCVRVPLVYLFGRIGGGSLLLIGLATPCSSVVQILLCICVYRRYAAQETKPRPPEGKEGSAAPEK